MNHDHGTFDSVKKKRSLKGIYEMKDPNEVHPDDGEGERGRKRSTFLSFCVEFLFTFYIL